MKTHMGICVDILTSLTFFLDEDSADGNLAHFLPLMILDECPELGLPIGTIISSLYMFYPDPMDISLYDSITSLVYWGTGAVPPTIEFFVKKALAGRCAVKVVHIQACAHCWFLAPATVTRQGCVDAVEA